MKNLNSGEGHTPAGFPRSHRLLSPGDYRLVFQGRNSRVSNRYWTILAVKQRQESQGPATSKEGNGSTPISARLGMAIAKKRARRAVDRNRCKRVIRESFRHNHVRLAGLDIVVMNRDASANSSAKELRVGIEQLWEKLLKETSREIHSDNRKGGRPNRK